MPIVAANARVLFTVLLMASPAFLVAAPAPAAAATVAEIAGYSKPDRQSVLEAGAKKEGKLLIYCTGTQIDPMVKAFEAKYPFIKVELFREDSVKVAQKTMEEYAAGVHNVDGFELSSNGLVPINSKNIIIPFSSPESKNYPDSAFGPKKVWIVVRESYTGFGWNTTLVPADKAPKSFEDMLDPFWKGKMSVSGSPATSSNWVGTMMLEKGEDFVRRVGRQEVRVFGQTARAVANLMITGEVIMSPNTYDSHVDDSRKKGAPLAYADPDAVPVTDTGISVARNAPHPHAMMLFTDYLMSTEGQKAYIAIGYSSARSDMVPANAPKKKHYMASRPNFVRDFEQWNKLFKDVFTTTK